jgi:hypothetical protein
MNVCVQSSRSSLTMTTICISIAERLHLIISEPRRVQHATTNTSHVEEDLRASSSLSSRPSYPKPNPLPRDHVLATSPCHIDNHPLLPTTHHPRTALHAHPPGHPPNHLPHLPRHIHTPPHPTIYIPLNWLPPPRTGTTLLHAAAWPTLRPGDVRPTHESRAESKDG